jgi:hypothetical protein
MIKESKLSGVGDVKPIINSVGDDPSKVKFGNVLSNPYNTTFLCAKRKSGKTSVLAEILDKTSNKNTIFWVFCPTTNIDDSWKSIITKLQNKGCLVNVFDSIMEGKRNQLNEIVDALSKGCDNDEPETKPIKKLICDSVQEEEQKEKKERKPKKISPEHIFCFDDISSELKNPSVNKLLKMSRHLKAAVYLSFQYACDIRPEAWVQAQYCILFKSFSEEKLQHVYKYLDLSLDFEKFKELYQYVMKDNGGVNYNFLFIDVKNQSYRKNFKYQLSLDN